MPNDAMLGSVDKPHDPVTNPHHYVALTPSSVEVIEAWDLGFHLGNAVKYIARAGRKGDAVQDLCKAAWYLERKIQLLRQACGK
jgi:hypothetical protein